MGTERTQPLTLICNYPDAQLYTLQADLSGLKILNIKIGLDWALSVAYNRGKMDVVRDSAIYRKYRHLNRDYDMIIGYIANDRMFVVLDRFFNGEITDLALIHSLSALKLGKQYVARTEKACSQIHILRQDTLSEAEREHFKQQSLLNRSAGIALADEICRRYRREGQFFDEILEAGK